MGERSFYFKVLIIGVLFVLVYRAYFDGGHQRAIAGIPDPRQTAASGGIDFPCGDYNVHLDYLYAYDLEALVVSTENYHGSGIGEQLVPKDLALAWGPVAAYNDQIDFHWKQSGRWYFWSTDTYEEIEPVGGTNGVTAGSANNHFIPANDTVLSNIKKVKTGDHIHATGRCSGAHDHPKSRTYQNASGNRSGEKIICYRWKHIQQICKCRITKNRKKCICYEFTSKTFVSQYNDRYI